MVLINCNLSKTEQIDEQLNHIKTLSKETGIDFSPCEEIAHKVHRNVIELIDETTSCVTKKVAEVTAAVDPLKAKVEETKGVLSNFLKATSECVEDPNTSVIQNGACIADVSTQYNLRLFIIDNDYTSLFILTEKCKSNF